MTITGLPAMEFPFHFEIKGNITGKDYVGDFVWKRLDIMSKIESEKFTVRLNGDLTTVDDDVKTINKILGKLKFGLKSFPQWWEDSNFGLNLYDDNVLIELWIKIDQWDQEWLKKVWEKEPEKPEGK